MRSLTRPETLWRLACLALLPILLLGLALAGPDSLPAWFPFATSCGAITGLPCIFCGMTRAFHYLLRGDFAKALYYNWLVYPAIAGAATIVAVNVLELTTGRNLFAKIPPIRLTRTSLSAMAVCLVLLWCLQVYLAVSQHKTELLNPNGPLYSLVVH